MSQTLDLSDLNPTLIEHVRRKSEAGVARLFSKLSRKEVAAQIRHLRERRGLTQMKFAKVVRMKQSAVSRIEQATYSGWNYKTLARIAEKLHARLRITFEPLEDVLAKMETEDDAGWPVEDSSNQQAAKLEPVQTTTLGADQTGTKHIDVFEEEDEWALDEFPHNQRRSDDQDASIRAPLQ